MSASVAVAASLLVAAPAGAALPVRDGDFWNGSPVNGVSFHTTRHSVQDLQFFCKRLRFDLQVPLHVRKDGTFSYRGGARKYGRSADPQGIHKVKVEGRFTDSKHVRIERKLGSCGTATVRARAR